MGERLEGLDVQQGGVIGGVGYMAVGTGWWGWMYSSRGGIGGADCTAVRDRLVGLFVWQWGGGIVEVGCTGVGEQIDGAGCLALGE